MTLPLRTALVWAALGLAVLAPLAAAATSPLLAWRDAIYIASGFAGIFAMTLLLVQPLLAAGDLPGRSAGRARRVHRATGALLLVAVLVHVGGLWVTSPPDVVDALLYASPTPFSAWGVTAMWVMFCAAALALLRRHLPVRPATWRGGHMLLAAVVALTTVLHAALIDGTMERMTKIGLSALVLLANARVIYLKLILPARRRRG